MTENITSPEQTRQIVEGWIGKISEEGTVEDIDTALIRSALEEAGANFEPTPELGALREYTNKAKRPGLDSVWGRERVEEYKEWVEGYIGTYEKLNLARPLPGLKKSGSKASGMIQFFGELTALAAGKLSFTDFKRYTQTRALNGRLWFEGKKEERVRTAVPTAREPILISSFPPGFPSAAWDKIKSWRK